MMLDFLLLRISFKFKYLLALTLTLLYSVFLFSGTSYLPWYRGWETDIFTESCGLAAYYADKTALLSSRVSVDEYVTFDSFYLRFSIPIKTQEHLGKTFTKGALYLYLVSHSGEILSNKQHRIIAVSSRGHQFKTYALGHSPSIRNFYLEAAAARSVFNALRRTEKTQLVLALDDKSSRTLMIRNESSDRFTILADMLKACYISRVSRSDQSN